MSKLRIPTYIEGEGHPERPEYRKVIGVDPADKRDLLLIHEAEDKKLKESINPVKTEPTITTDELRGHRIA